MFRKAAIEDLDRIEEIYNQIHSEEEAGRISANWKREVYPTKKTAIEAVLLGDMFVECDNGIIVACARINKCQLAEYSQVDWKYKADNSKIMVLHTLAVSPKYVRKGYGGRFVEFYEKYAFDNQCRNLRIDTWEKNTVARTMYQKLGYEEAGIVTSTFNGISDFRLICLEKLI